MNEFKAGDLALVIKARNPENLGKVVELLRCSSESTISHQPYADGNTANDQLALCWVVKGSGILVGRKHISDLVTLESVAVCPQSHLMPLKGDFAPIKEKQEEQPA